ncbi:mucin-2 [Procambarus clarkii]|uniref:mucin-2 n=1 Tax=Procambarus clarkii TaxID=6728 RepID=UPI003742A2BC
MAAIASRSLPRLSTSMHTTSTLLPQALTPAATRPRTLTPKATRPSTRTPTPTLAYTNTPSSRTITSYQGLQSQPEPWKIVEELHIPEDVEEEEEEATGLHLEALQMWRDSFGQ